MGGFSWGLFQKKCSGKVPGNTEAGNPAGKVSRGEVSGKTMDERE